MKPLFSGLAALLLSAPLHAAVYAHYSFDTDYSDSSGNSRNGTLTDVGTIGNSGITSTVGSYVFGGGAVNFSADRDYVDLGAMSTFGSGNPYTFSFWARKTAGDTGQAADYDMVIGDRGSSNFFIALNDVTGSGLRWRSSSSATERQADFTAAKDYAWHHYAIVASGTTITLYVDGQLVTTATGKMTGFQWNTIGEAYPNTQDFDFNGQIDEMWIFNEALDATAISNLYQHNVPEPSSLLLSTAGLCLAFRRSRKP
jgi:arabinan endo-1,5-alpha-L-arabinosidase